MAIANAYVQNYGQIPDLFQKISEGQAPELFTIQHLKDIGFTSANHRAFIPLLKILGFLSSEGKPTQRYHAYRDPSLCKRIMGEALREAYGGIFVIKEKLTKADQSVIKGKFKSAHNVSDRVALLMAKTFLSLLDLADMSIGSKVEGKHLETLKETIQPETPPRKIESETEPEQPPRIPGLHYNIQIHLPASKDIEVFNAIFKSLKEHLFES